MPAVHDRETKSCQLARHYLEQLRLANNAFRRGGESSNRAFAAFDQDWPQIRHWQAWTASHLAQADRAVINTHVLDDIAAICNAFPEAGKDLLAVRQSPQEIITWREAALAIARSLEDRSAEAAHLTGIGNAYLSLGSFEQARAYAEQALALVEQSTHPALRAENLTTLGKVALVRGALDEARAYYEQSLSLNRQIANKEGIGEALRNIADIFTLQGEAESALDYAEQSLAISREIGHQIGIINALSDLGSMTNQLGNLTAARTYFEQGLALARRFGSQQQIARLVGNLGVIASTLGDYATAIDYYQQTLAISQVIGNQRFIATALNNLGWIYYKQGDGLRALDHVQQSLAIARAIGYPDTVVERLGNLVHILASLDQLDSAARCLREGLTLIKQLKTDPNTQGLLTNAAVLWLKLGKPEKAAQWIGLYLTLASPGHNFREYVVTFVCPQIEAALGSEKAAAEMERGRSLTVDSVVQEIEEELDRLENASPSHQN
jgi:tetratricopeptide (TPR) repeat protein